MSASFFGFRLDSLPDILKDHTLLGDSPEKRLEEHCRRWTHFIGALWEPEEAMAAYSLCYNWLPNGTHYGSSQLSHGSTRRATTASCLHVCLVGRAETGVLDKVRASTLGLLQAQGIIPVEMSQDDLQEVLGAAFGFATEVRQQDQWVQVASMTYAHPGLIHAMYAGSYVQQGNVYEVSPWWGPGGPFSDWVYSLAKQADPARLDIVLEPTTLSIEEHRTLAALAAQAETAARTQQEASSLQASTSTAEFTADPQAKWLARLSAANLRRLSTAYLCTVIVRAHDSLVSQKIAQGISSAIHSHLSVEIPVGEDTKIPSRATVRPVPPTLANRLCQRLSLAEYTESSRLSSDTYPEHLDRLRHLMDSRGVATVFRVPVSVEGGLPAIKVEQIPPDFLPGPQLKDVPTGCISLGKFHGGGLCTIPVESFRKHSLITGFTGSGKTNTVHRILRELWFLGRSSSTRPTGLRCPDPVRLAIVLASQSSSFSNHVWSKLPTSSKEAVNKIKLGSAGPRDHSTLISSIAKLSRSGLLDLSLIPNPPSDLQEAAVPGEPPRAANLLALAYGLQNTLHATYPGPNQGGIPFLVIESAKNEYRGLSQVEGFRKVTEDLLVFTLGDETTAPFRLNPFELLPGVRVESHISKLQTCFEAAMPAIGPLSSILAEALELVYRQRGWSLIDEGPPAITMYQFRTGDWGSYRPFPTLTDFYDLLPKVIANRKYAGEVLSNITAATVGRLKPLLMGSRGQTFDTPRSIPFDYLMERPAVLEMNELNEQDKALMTMFLLTFLREHRDKNKTSYLSHVTVVEEAHNVLENTASKAGSETSSDAKHKAVMAFCGMLAEIRALGEGIIIADQSPEKLAPDAMRNTNVQIAHQLRDSHDREAVANAMIMSQEQEEYLGKLRPGRAAIFYTGLEKATFVEVDQFAPPPTLPDHLRRQYPGYGMRSVSDAEVRSLMDPIVSSYRKELPLPGCELCSSVCIKRSLILEHPRAHEAQRHMDASINELNQAAAEKDQVQSAARRKRAWDDIVNNCCAHSVESGHSASDVDGAWCSFVHLYPRYYPFGAPSSWQRERFEQQFTKRQGG